MRSVKIKSYAKVNLTLEITGVENGYHTLNSLVASIDLYDLLVIKKRKGALSSITMKGMGSESIPPEKNNALKAAEAFSQTFGTDGADITVYKNIPIGAGLGGSSADVVGVINGMAKLYNVGDRVAISGRIQSREYQKRYSEEEVKTMTAYEVSVSKLATFDSGEDFDIETEFELYTFKDDSETSLNGA